MFASQVGLLVGRSVGR